MRVMRILFRAGMAGELLPNFLRNAGILQQLSFKLRVQGIVTTFFALLGVNRITLLCQSMAQEGDSP